ncbi:unnamed protein product [Triticum turgidum subsp. durum]|uniref:Carbohydrate kinase PfkB domain-containing protein n=1 Tax=Triticum turgidum subsp. durum TaxID=4567 RepID=A0A9R0QTR0_TRITD|nr:unnamed protein product [Triticum turgidum subsp. durum]
MTDAAASSSRRRMEAVRRHLLPRPPPVLSLNQLSAPEAGQSPVIIGGMVLDIHAKPSVPPHPGTTVPGMVKYIGGGVARNIAECMAKLGTQPLMISAIGDDMAGNFLLKYWKLAGLCTDGILQVPDITTPVVSNVFDGNGELFAGVASVQAVETFLTPSWIYQFYRRISTAPLLMLDANLSPESLQAACKVAYESGVPVLFEPVSVVKSSRIAPIAEHITCTSPNEIELIAMANALSTPGKYNFVKLEQCNNKAESVDYLFEMLSPAMLFLLEKGIKLLLVTLGSNGVFICCREHVNFMKDQKSLTGAGDCLVGGFLSSLCGGLDIMQSVAVGIAVAKASVESEANIPANFSAASIAEILIQTTYGAK